MCVQMSSETTQEHSATTHSQVGAKEHILKNSKGFLRILRNF